MESLALPAQGGGGCSIPGNIPAPVGWDLEQPGLVKGGPGHGRVWKERVCKGSFQPKPLDDCTVLGYGESC